MDDSDSGGFPTGFFIGAVTGVLLGFLIAPMAGKQMRDNIREKAGTGLHRAKEAAAGVAGTAARKLTHRQP
jgi:gas vesicle protein